MLLPLAFAATMLAANASGPADALHAQAQRVTIVRDDWGIAHVRAKTDADVVFGIAYTQAEDDFNRVENNYLTQLGLQSEAQGQKAIYQDLRYRLFLDPEDLRAQYKTAPAWLQKLMTAWANGLNFYLATHPDVHPRVIAHFEPWMALSFTEGSIGGDIEDVDLDGLRAFYGGERVSLKPARLAQDAPIVDPQGSNGIAIAPKNTVDGHALLLINPHTSFYFRSVLQMTSDEGLNAYGAVTWGQFFIYQGWNEHCGWMHTSTGANNVDQFAETIVRKGGKPYYKYGSELRPVTVSKIDIKYRLPDGTLADRIFTVYHTHHGPIVESLHGKWIAEALMNRPVPALEQSYLRTKATDYASFRHVAELQSNSSNDTIFADSKGEIAYMDPQFMPLRNDRFDYTKPVDGSNPATDWRGIVPLDRDVHVLDPAAGYVFNTNNWPWTAAGADSPKRTAYPRYMEQAGEDARGVHAAMLLSKPLHLSIEGLRALAFDTNLPLFAALVPGLTRAYDALPATDALKQKLAGPIDALRGWDDRWSAASIPTALAVFWVEDLAHAAGDIDQRVLDAATPAQKLESLSRAVDKLDADFGSWQTQWGNINRFQRLTGAIHATYDDAAPSIPVPFVAGDWGSLASFDAVQGPNTKRRYGYEGNSFVAVVEFGDRVSAIAITAGGESGHPDSPHFNDQAMDYSTGDLQPVYFYPDQLAGHTVRTYHPGD